MANKPQQWTLTDHVCRQCFGRLLKGTDADGKPLVRCSHCGTEQQSARVETLCCCGAKLPNGRLAGLKCAPNPCPNIEQPAQIVVVYAGERKCRG